MKAAERKAATIQGLSSQKSLSLSRRNMLRLNEMATQDRGTAEIDLIPNGRLRNPGSLNARELAHEPSHSLKILSEEKSL